MTQFAHESQIKKILTLRDESHTKGSVDINALLSESSYSRKEIHLNNMNLTLSTFIPGS